MPGKVDEVRAKLRRKAAAYLRSKNRKNTAEGRRKFVYGTLTNMVKAGSIPAFGSLKGHY